MRVQVAIIACLLLPSEGSGQHHGTTRPFVVRSAAGRAATERESEVLRATYQRFLDAIHSRDTVAMRAMMVPSYNALMAGDSLIEHLDRHSRLRALTADTDRITQLVARTCRYWVYPESAVGHCSVDERGTFSGVTGHWFVPVMTFFVHVEDGSWRVASGMTGEPQRVPD